MNIVKFNILVVHKSKGQPVNADLGDGEIHYQRTLYTVAFELPFFNFYKKGSFLHSGFLLISDGEEVREKGEEIHQTSQWFSFVPRAVHYFQPMISQS